MHVKRTEVDIVVMNEITMLLANLSATKDSESVSYQNSFKALFLGKERNDSKKYFILNWLVDCLFNTKNWTNWTNPTKIILQSTSWTEHYVIIPVV